MVKKSFLTRDEVRDVYNKRARIYDLAVWFYYLVVGERRSDGLRNNGGYRPRVVLELLQIRCPWATRSAIDIKMMILIPACRRQAELGNGFDVYFLN